jgi:hypothetical protein
VTDALDGDDWRALKKHGQRRREQNRATSTARLQAAGIAFVARNGGAHLIVEGRVDYWPGTGRWIARGTPDNGRGVRGLIDHLKGSAA